MDLEVRSENLDAFLNEARKRRVVLFVGSGINGKAAPRWEVLLGSLMSKTVDGILFEERHLEECRDESFREKVRERVKNLKNEYGKATLIKKVLANRYETCLAEEVYKDFRINEFGEYVRARSERRFRLDSGDLDSTSEKYEFLTQTARLCCSKRVEAVVTYNYDDFLETAIREIGRYAKHGEMRREVVSVPSEDTLDDQSPDPLCIYHVHGILPRPGGGGYRGGLGVVLAMEEYFQNMLEPFSWQTATQLHFLMNRVCLFLGASLEDWNMLRMLSFAEKQTSSRRCFALRRPKQGSTRDPAELIMAKTRSTILDGVGVRSIVVGSRDGIEIWRVVAGISERLEKRGGLDLHGETHAEGGVNES